MHAAWAGQLAFVQYLLTVQADKDAENNQVKLKQCQQA